MWKLCVPLYYQIFLGVSVHADFLRMWKIEAGGPEVQGQPGVYEILS